MPTQADVVSPVMTMSSPVLTKSLLFRATNAIMHNASSREHSMFSTDNQGAKLVSNTNDTMNYE